MLYKLFAYQHPVFSLEDRDGMFLQNIDSSYKPFTPTNLPLKGCFINLFMAV
jgi:hypothetical protein